MDPSLVNEPPLEPVVEAVVVPLSLRQRVSRLKVVFGLIFLLGMGSAVASPNIPDLIVDTFGGDSYVVSGLFDGASGLLACVYAPLVGALSDGKRRRVALLVTQALGIIPTAVYLASRNYWAYAITNTIFGVSGPTLALLMTCVADYIPPTCPARTETFAMTMFFLLLGIGVGPFCGMALDPYWTFAIGCAAAVLAVVITFFFLPAPERYRDEDEAAVKAVLESNGERPAAVCPVLRNHIGRVSSVSVSGPAPPPRERREAEPLLSAASACPHLQGARAAAASEAVVAVAYADDADDATAVVPVVAPQPGAADAAATPQGSCCAHVAHACRRMKEVVRVNRELRYVLLIVFWSCMSQESLESNLMLYLKNKLSFNSNDFTVLIAIVSLSGLVSLGFVVPILRRLFGTLKTMAICIIGNIFFALLLCFAAAKWEALAIMTLGIFGYGVYPCGSALVAHTVDPKDAGAAQGIVTSMRMMAQAIGPTVFGGFFRLTQHTALPGTPYLLGSACGVVALATAILVARIVSLP